MSITVNVENVGLRELKALYYNDNGTIRELNEFWTNDGTDVKCLFRKRVRLFWKIGGSNTAFDSSENYGYTVIFKDKTYKTSLHTSGGLKTNNSIKLSNGQTITVKFTRDSLARATFMNFITIYNSDGSVAQQTDILESSDLTNTITLTIEASGEYKIGLFAAASDGANYYYQTPVTAEISIE